MTDTADRLALQDLVHRYAYYIDLKQVEEWVGLFIPEGCLDESPMEMGVHAGQAAIRTYGEQLAADVIHVVHLMSNQILFEIDKTHASGSVFALVEAITRSTGHMRYYIRYEDRYVKTGPNWRFVTRVVAPLLPPQEFTPR